MRTSLICHALFAALLVAAITLTTACKKESAGEGSRGRVDFIAGSVTLNGTAAAVGDVVLPGVVIKTGDKSFCDIVFDEKNIIRIIENSDAMLHITDESREIQLDSGGVANILMKLGKLSKTDAPLYRLRTPTTVASVRGTVFFVKVEDRDSTYICDCNGVIEIGDAEGTETRKVESSHHTGFQLVREGGKILMRPSGMKHHDDRGVEALAARIGVTVDWTKIGR